MNKSGKRSFVLSILVSFIISPFVYSQDVSLDLQKPRKVSEQQKTDIWNRLPESVLVGFGTTSVRYSNELPPEEALQQTWKIKAWRNEKIYTQIVVSTKDNINNLTVLKSNLANKNEIIDASAIQAGFVQYVMTDEFKNGCGVRKSEDFDSSLVADIINNDLSHIRVEGNHTQPIWVSIDVPENTIPGNYSGIITIKADQNEFRLGIEVSVSDRRLPDPEEWSFELDLWQHPAAIARVSDVSLWSDEHFMAMRKYYSMLARAGQKVITASIVEEPWNHQTYDDYPGLIKWTKKKDGTWMYDYALFDKYIRFVMSCGITERINCYSMVPWKIQFPYFDERLNKDAIFTGAIGTPAYNEFWGNMLKDFTQHLKEKGWFDITTIAMDERPMKDMQDVISLLKSIDPSWKISLAGDYHPEIEKDIYDYCVAYRWTFPEDVLKEREAKGQKSTWYTSCSGKYPNLFTFSPPDEATFIGWYTAGAGMDGYLRWAYNSWTADPLKDSRFITWPAGDTYQIYPGPHSSIRFEKLIEGIQDFEKIKILKQEYAKNNKVEKLKELNAALQTFQIKNLENQSARQMINNAVSLLNE